MSFQRKIRNMDLAQISASGQCFRMWKTEPDFSDNVRKGLSAEKRREAQYTLIARDRYLKVSQSGEKFTFSCGEKEMKEFWNGYFDLDRDYGEVIRKIDPEDRYLKQAAEYGSGIRILRQDLWEMIITFIISQQNNIRRIRKCIETISEKYGEICTAPDGTVYYAFPEPEKLAASSEEELRICGLGYRSRYLVQTARMIADGSVLLKDLPEMPAGQAKQELLRLSGVGEKVADCIRLFALHDLDAFPVDTHISKVLSIRYPRGFPFMKYPGTAGILQQYIFYYDLMQGERKQS